MTRVDMSRAVWRKSSRSGGINGGTDQCVEVAALGDRVAVRDSKQPNGAVLSFTSAELTAWISSVKAGVLSPVSGECG